jgi:ABC-type uncharacterized transport system auxiliary subunit
VAFRPSRPGLRFVNRRVSRRRTATAARATWRRAPSLLAWCCVCFVQLGCIRGKLPARQFYRLAAADSLAAAPLPTGAPPLTGSIAIVAYDTPGIYGDGALVYRVGASDYGKYPTREWAIPLGEMLAANTETIAGGRSLTSGRIAFDRLGSRREQYEWRGTVREFDEVDVTNAVSVSVSLSARLVRVADDSVVWSGSSSQVESVREARRIESVVDALSAASSRALMRLVDDAATSLRRVAAAGAQRP